MRLPYVLLVSILTPLTFAQVSSDLVKVTHSGDDWFLTNLTKKAITGYVIHTGHEPLQFNLKLINCAPGEWENKPIPPGVKTQIMVKPGFDNVDLPAVIFEDGSVAGSAKTIEGMDIVEEMFSLRRAEARESQRWVDLVSLPDHVQALDAYREAVTQARVARQEHPPGSLAESGQANAADEAAGQMEQVSLLNPNASPSLLHTELLKRLQARAKFYARSSRRAQ